MKKKKKKEEKSHKLDHYSCQAFIHSYVRRQAYAKVCYHHFRGNNPKKKPQMMLIFMLGYTCCVRHQAYMPRSVNISSVETTQLKKPQIMSIFMLARLFIYYVRRQAFAKACEDNFRGNNPKKKSQMVLMFMPGYTCYARHQAYMPRSVNVISVATTRKRSNR